MLGVTLSCCACILVHSHLIGYGPYHDALQRALIAVADTIVNSHAAAVIALLTALLAAATLGLIVVAALLRKSTHRLAARKSSPSTTTFVVWTQEFEFTLSPSGSQAGEEEEVKIKGRCTTCWGGLVLRGEGENGAVSGIECFVCKKKLVGEDAGNAYHRVLEEATNNVWKMSLGFPPTREHGPFAGKLFPHLPRQTEDDVRERIASKASKVKRGNPGEWLTRTDFPLGDAAYLYLQARLFVATISDIYASNDEAVVSFRKAKTSDDPRHDANDLNRRLGSTMARGMMSAFACELAMKAISLTVNDAARKTHDLLCLYDRLPESSRQRLEFDSPDIRTVMQNGRHTFGEWRYFQSGKKKALQAIIDTDLEQSLGKAARVFLDEAETVGLRGGVDMKARRDVTDHGDTKKKHYKYRATIRGAENPPKLV